MGFAIDPPLTLVYSCSCTVWQFLSSSLLPFTLSWSLLDPPKAQVNAAREKREGEDGDDEQVAAPIVEERQDRGDDVQPAPGPVALKCCVMLQKEGPEGLYDEECGAVSPDKMAGLCEYETNCRVTFEAFLILAVM